MGLWDDPGPDKGWSFVILFASWLLSFSIFTPLRSGGLLYHQMMVSMNITPEQASWPFSLQCGVGAVSGLSLGYLLIRYSCRQIIICMTCINILGFVLCFAVPLDILWITMSMGIVYGVSYGVIASLLNLPVIEYFEEYRTTALGVSLTGVGVSLTGVGVSGVLIPMIAKSVFEYYDLRGVLLLTGIFMSHNMFLAGTLYRKRTPEQFPCLRRNGFMRQAVTPDNESNELKNLENTEKPNSLTTKLKLGRLLDAAVPSQLRKLLRNPVFVLLCATSCLMESSFYASLWIIVSTSVSKGLSEASSSFSLSLVSLGDISAKFVLSVIVDKKIVSAEVMYSLTAFAQALCIFVFGHSRNIIIVQISLFFYGFVFGGFHPVRGSIAAKRFGVNSYAFAISIMRAVSGVFLVLNPTLTGALSGEGIQPFVKLCYVYSVMVAISFIIWPAERFFRSSTKSDA